VAILCRCLDVTRSGFYAWQRRPESPHARRDRQVRVLVRASFEASKHRYGSPRIHEDLLEQDVRVSRKRVIRLMREEGLKARVRKRFTCTTMSDHDQPVAANLLDRHFTAAAPNRRWVGDTTEFVIGESGKLYLAAILDLFSRFVVGWAVSAVNDRHLALKALSGGRAVAPFRPGLDVRERSLPTAARCVRHHLLDEPPRRLLRQRGDGSVLLVAEERGGGPLSELRRSQDGVVRLHRGVLQPATTTLDPGPGQSGRIRTKSGYGRCQSRGRTDRAHRSLENRKERGFPQRPQPSSLLVERRQKARRSV
jgi:hypothetical protein